MYQVVAPAVQFEGCSGRTIVKLEKTVVDLVVVGNLLQCLRPEGARHFLLERFGKKTVDIVIAVVHEHKTAVLNISFEMIPFLGRKFNQLMAAQVAKRAFEDFAATQRDYFFLLVDRDSGILYQRMQQIGRHSLVGIPITRCILYPGEEKRPQY